MKTTLVATLVAAVAACGGGGPKGPLNYTDPTSSSAKLLLVKDKTATSTNMVLDFVVGSTALTGYSTGFDLPLDATKVALGPFTPGTALSPGTSNPAAKAALPTSGPLTGTLVVAQSQKATDTASDAMLAAGTVLLTVELDYVTGAPDGIVFDGGSAGFVLPSGGLLDRTGNAVALPTDVAIGTLEVVGQK